MLIWFNHKKIEIQYEKGVYGAKCINERWCDGGEMILVFCLPSSFAFEWYITITLWLFQTHQKRR
jgi:hypothetical protein